MTLIEKDFGEFLSELGYSKSTSTIYPYYLKKFASENGYANLIDLADDVFSLLDKGKFDNRDFNKKTLSDIKKYNSVLTLFNSFLFDIDFERRFFIRKTIPLDYLGVLVTDKTYIPGVRPRTLKDNNYENKQWFTTKDVMDALHIDKKTLERWAKKDKEGKLKEHFPHRYKGKGKGDIDLSTCNSKSGVFRYYYYRLDELNDFLAYQFYDCKGTKREQFLSETDIRKSKKKKIK